MAQPPGLDDTSVEADKLGFWAARQICRRESRSLYLASLLLPQSKRQGFHAVYAFTRMIRAAIDQGACGPSELDHRSALFQYRLNEVYDGTLELPLTQFRSEERRVGKECRIR